MRLIFPKLNNIKRSVLTISFVMSVIVKLYSQTPNNATPGTKVIPPLPESAALGKFGNIPVGLFTGIPQISIPIHTIKIKNFELPISIDYHASGVRVEEISSNVGIGWALNAGGMISCTVNNINDFDSHGLYRIGDALYNLYKNNSWSSLLNSPNQLANGSVEYETLRDMADGSLDGQPDEFNFNFGGRAGKFVFDENKQPRLIPYQPLKIEYNEANNSFSIIDEKGVKYQFTEVEVAQVQPASSSNCNTFDPFHSIINYTPTWYLSKVTVPTGQEIQFFYQNISYSYFVSTNQTVFDSPEGYGCFALSSPNNSNCKMLMDVTTGKRIDRIQTNDGQLVQFIYGAEARLDLPGTNRLSSIIVKRDGIQKYSWTLNHEYFTAEQNNNDPTNYRLKLLSVQQAGRNPHTFQYNGFLPARTSLRQDFWGYYNGAGNGTLIPQVYLNNGDLLSGADREVNPLVNQAGVLTKVTYPTNGNTEFEYESNDYFFNGQEGSFINKFEHLSFSGMDTKTVTFTIGNAIKGSLYFQSNAGNLPPGDMVSARLQDISSNLPPCSSTNFNCPLDIYLENQSTSRIVKLEPNHTYTLTLHSSTDVYTQSNGTLAPIETLVTFNWSEKSVNTVSKNYYAGGLRVKQIIDQSDGSGVPIIKKYSYRLPENGVQSSGYIINDPVLAYYNEFWQPNPEEPWRYDPPCTYVVRSSNSMSGLSSIKGNSVGYEYVTVTHGIEGNGGKVVSQFKKYQDIGAHIQSIKGIVYEHFPAVNQKTTNYDFLRGLLIKETVFAKSDNTFLKKSMSVYKYKTDSDLSAFLPALTTGTNNKNILGLSVYRTKPPITSVPQQNTGSTGPPPPTVLMTGEFKMLYNYFVSNWYYLEEEQKTSYDLNGNNPVESTTKYFYDNPAHAQLTRTVTTDSNTGQITKVSTFANDYATGTGFIDDMKAMHQIAYPIEQVIYKTTNNQNSVISGEIATYKIGGQGLPDKISKLKTFYPIPQSDYRFSNNVQGNMPYTGVQQSFSPDSRFHERTLFKKYDVAGNILELSDQGGIPVSYLWGYNYTYAVAEIKNATYQDVVNILGQSEIDQLNSNPGTKQQVIDKIAPLRIGLPHSQVTIYTYDPLIGMTSMTDPKGQKTHFFYDAFQRLSQIKDKDQQIVKQYNYNYAVQPGLPVNITANWQNTSTAVRCKQNGSSQNTGEQEQEQRDANSASPTYNQTRWVVVATNTTSCPLPNNCNTCYNEWQRCINGNCETGIKVYTSSQSTNNGMYNCTYHYEFYDGSWSDSYTEVSSVECNTAY